MKRIILLTALIIMISPILCDDSLNELKVWDNLELYFTSPKIVHNGPAEIFDKLLTAIDHHYIGMYLSADADQVLFWAPVGDALHFMTNPPSYFSDDEQAINYAREFFNEIAGLCLGYDMESWTVVSGELEIRKNYNPEIELNFTLKHRRTGSTKEHVYRGNF